MSPTEYIQDGPELLKKIANYFYDNHGFNGKCSDQIAFSIIETVIANALDLWSHEGQVKGWSVNLPTCLRVGQGHTERFLYISLDIVIGGEWTNDYVINVVEYRDLEDRDEYAKVWEDILKDENVRKLFDYKKVSLPSNPSNN